MAGWEFDDAALVLLDAWWMTDEGRRAAIQQAYTAGRAGGIEEAAKVNDEKAKQAAIDQPDADWALQDAAASIRALAGKE